MTKLFLVDVRSLLSLHLSHIMSRQQVLGMNWGWRLRARDAEGFPSISCQWLFSLTKREHHLLQRKALHQSQEGDGFFDL